MKNQRQKNPFRAVLICTVILALLAGAAAFGGKYIQDNRDQMLSRMQQEAAQKNEEANRQYQLALAEFWAEHNQDGTNDAWPTAKAEGWDVVDLTSYPLEEAATASFTRQETMYNGMLLVNQWHTLPADFSEDQLLSVSRATNKDVPVKDSSVSLFPDAVAALQQMITAAKTEAGLEHYNVDQGYRSVTSQQSLFDQNQTKVPAGASDYHAGQSFHVALYHKDDKAINDYSSHIFEIEHGQWLAENCWRFGFVFRFPLLDYPTAGTADTSYKTGIAIKLQTFRYVGLGNAAAMRALNMCLEEYLEYLAAHPHIAVFENGTLKYEITRQWVGDGSSFTIQTTGKRSVRNSVTSLDNMGYAVTVYSY